MKINHLNESSTMRFKKARNYNDTVKNNQNHKNSTLFLVSDEGTFSLESSVDKLSDILISNNLPTPVLIDKPQASILESLKRTHKNKKSN